MKKENRWVGNETDELKISELAKSAGIPTLLARVLLSRGIGSREAIAEFLNPSADNFYDPFLLKDMDIASDRILDALRKKERVVIYTDYDADGVSCASVLIEYFGHLGLDSRLYIPERETEGYGISELGVAAIKNWGASLVVTADCGISAFREIDELMGCGIDVIVTDHHECADKLPAAYAVVNPCRTGSSYPFRDLAGAGVVFKLVQALSQKTGEKNKFLEYIDLAAIGTVCDVVPLTGENRAIAKLGIQAMNKNAREGIKALAVNSGIGAARIEAYHLGYMLGPRLNAAGRLGSAVKSVNLLISKDPHEAAKIAQELGTENTERQLKEKLIVEEAVARIEKETLEFDKVIVVSGKNWHPGVIGIAAARITEKYYKPCIVFSEGELKAKGSCRSIRGFNIFEALSECGDLLEDFGGHEMAAGLSINKNNIDEFRRQINKYASAIDESIFSRTIYTEGDLPETEITLENARSLKLLEPFGCGNPLPYFTAAGLGISDIRAVGNGKHLKLKLVKNKKAMDAIAFNTEDPTGGNYKNALIDAVFSLDINSWNNMESVQLKISDIKVSKLQRTQ